MVGFSLPQNALKSKGNTTRSKNFPLPLQERRVALETILKYEPFAKL